MRTSVLDGQPRLTSFLIDPLWVDPPSLDTTPANPGATTTDTNQTQIAETLRLGDLLSLVLDEHAPTLIDRRFTLELVAPVVAVLDLDPAAPARPALAVDSFRDNALEFSFAHGVE
jgi:hypothetical protein